MEVWPQEQPEPINQETFQARFSDAYPSASPDEVQEAWRDYRLWQAVCQVLPTQAARRGPAHCQLN